MPTWLRGLALVALVTCAVVAIRRHPLRPGERDALAWLTLAVVAIVVGVLAWSTFADS